MAAITSNEAFSNAETTRKSDKSMVDLKRAIKGNSEIINEESSDEYM